MKIILEGEFEIADESGQKVAARPGDVFYFPKGAKITFTTESYGLAFYVGSSRQWIDRMAVMVANELFRLGSGRRGLRRARAISSAIGASLDEGLHYRG
jgi:uncharacterized cupin superfamily protein